jgi:hypothetical protein
VLVEPTDLQKHYRGPDPGAVAKWKAQILEFFDTPDSKSDPLTEKLTDHDLDVAARAAVALEGLIEEKNLQGLAYYYEGEPGSDLRTLSSLKSTGWNSAKLPPISSRSMISETCKRHSIDVRDDLLDVLPRLAVWLAARSQVSSQV